MSVVNFKRMGDLGSEALTRFQSNVEQAFKIVNDSLLQQKPVSQILSSANRGAGTDFTALGFIFTDLTVGLNYRLEIGAKFGSTGKSQFFATNGVVRLVTVAGAVGTIDDNSGNFIYFTATATTITFANGGVLTGDHRAALQEIVVPITFKTI